MISFLEYSHNLEQISSSFDKMVKDRGAHSAGSQLSFILDAVPPDFMDKLPDGSRANAALVLRNILLHKTEAWDELGKFVEVLWDQPVPGPGQTLGRDLLNWVSAKVMEDTQSEFFISYSGKLSKSGAYHYTKKHMRVFVGNHNYRWGPYRKVLNTIQGDYAQHFTNYRQKQMER